MTDKNFKYVGSFFEVSLTPMSSVYTDDEDHTFISEWYDVENNVDMYFIYKIDNKILIEYLNGKITHYEMIHNGQDVHYHEHEFKNMKPLKLKTIKDALPKRDSMFDPSITNTIECYKVYEYLSKFVL